MLTFIVSEYGSVPQHSTIYESGYEIIAKEDMTFEPLSTINIHTGLILKCDFSDFIHIVIDNGYHNILKIENNIIENNINIPYDIKIINLTNTNITIQKNNKICHFYSNNKAFLYNTILQDKLIIQEVTPVVVQEAQPVVVQEAQHVVVEEVTPVVEEEVVQEEVVEEVTPVVVQEVVPEVVQEVVKEIVQSVEVHEDIHNDIHEENVGLTQTQINANIAKRKYIRKKKMIITLP